VRDKLVLIQGGKAQQSPEAAGEAQRPEAAAGEAEHPEAAGEAEQASPVAVGGKNAKRVRAEK